MTAQEELDLINEKHRRYQKKRELEEQIIGLIANEFPDGISMDEIEEVLINIKGGFINRRVKWGDKE